MPVGFGQARTFQSFARPEGGGGLRGPVAKNQGQHQPIKMKLRMSHHNHKSTADANFEADSSSSFEDMTSQNFPLEKGTVIKFGYLPPENGFNF